VENSSIKLNSKSSFSLILKGLDTCYSAACTSQTQEEQRFTISEVTAD